MMLLSSILPRLPCPARNIPGPLLSRSGHYLVYLYTSLSSIFPLSNLQAALSLLLKLRVESRVYFKGKEEQLSLKFKDAVRAYPSLGSLVALLPAGGRPAWKENAVQRNLNYPTLVLQARLVRDVRGLMAASRLRVYGLVVSFQSYKQLLQQDTSTRGLPFRHQRHLRRCQDQASGWVVDCSLLARRPCRQILASGQAKMRPRC